MTKLLCAGIQNQKQEPHTKMWGKMCQRMLSTCISGQVANYIVYIEWTGNFYVIALVLDLDVFFVQKSVLAPDSSWDDFDASNSLQIPLPVTTWFAIWTHLFVRKTMTCDLWMRQGDGAIRHRKPNARHASWAHGDGCREEYSATLQPRHVYGPGPAEFLNFGLTCLNPACS